MLMTLAKKIEPTFYLLYYNRHLGQVSCDYIEWVPDNIQFKWPTQGITLGKKQKWGELKMVSKSSVPPLGGRWGFSMWKVIW